jgi:UDP-N-acetylmuramate-alanine ligase
VLAVAGTHGKTTTTTILSYLLEAAGRSPGFLIGGVAEDFGVSARIGSGPDFVVEADEYDTAFFDKRSKFVHYRPLVAILNNLEYDHADIFPDVARSSASSITWCAPCRAAAGWSSTATTNACAKCWRWAAGRRWSASVWMRRSSGAHASCAMTAACSR